MSRPSILFLNRVFPPDRGATGRCLADLAGRFAAAGWRVTVLADGAGDCLAPPGVSVVRTGGRTGRMGRAAILAYGAVLLRLWWRGLALPRHDVVVTMTDPPLAALLGPLLGGRQGTVRLHWCQDLYPELLPVVHRPLPAPVPRLLRGLSNWALGRHDAVVATGSCMAERLRDRGLDPSRIVVIPNWADPAIREVSPADNLVRRRWAAGGRFVVAYSGNIGLAHPLEAVLEAAARLARTAPRVLFLIIGEGRGRARLEQRLSVSPLPNLRLLPWQPAERLAACLSAVDLHLAAMAEEACGLLVPSKVAGALAAGRPCVFLGPPASTAAQLLRRFDCGAVVAPHDAAGLAGLIRAYADDRRLWHQGCARARTAAASCGLDDAAGRFLALVERLRASRRRRLPARAAPAGRPVAGE